ncbi:RDD family protein [Austwickia chelonae]|uniref:RDD family protein n=1 Tax=Austwickia chelonae TaxID=100225 RepID=UPI000E25EF36|nr:RDD family protein [Austwickia chelonae]
MVNREDIGSWLNGPQLGGDPEDYPGQRLGLPQSGPGSIGRLSRRVPALLIDWGLCQLIAVGLLEHRIGQGGISSFAPLLVFLLENLLLVGTLGCTIGHRICGLRVVPLSGTYTGPVRALWRTVLLCLVIPAVVWDRDSRGMHDRWAGTLIIRT